MRKRNQEIIHGQNLILNLCDDGNYKKQISYLVKYKKNGKSKTKTVKKNKIKKLYSSSKIHVYAIVKVKKQRVPYMP